MNLTVRELHDKFDEQRRLLEDNGNVRDSLKHLLVLMEAFVDYLEEQKEEFETLYRRTRLLNALNHITKQK